MKYQKLMNIDTEKFTKIFTKYIYKKYIHIYKNKKYIQKNTIYNKIYNNK